MTANNYYLELFNDLSLDKISKEDKELMQIKLWTLLGYVTKRYTMGDSSSVPIETAEELLKSICFLLKNEIKNPQKKEELLKSENLETLWKEACANIEAEIKKGKSLLKKVISSSLSIENISYTDTIFEINKGLRVYDYRFLAHEIPCSIDYQLANPVSEELQGIEFINEYLRRLLFENTFCSNFSQEKIAGILNSYCEDYKEALINIFEPILTNALGLELLDEDILKLEMKSYEREVLLYTFKNMTMEKVKDELIKASESICIKLKINEDFAKEYVRETTMKLVPRVQEAIKNNLLSNIFLSFKFTEAVVKDFYVDNENMEDEKLRDLIEEIKSCRFTKDKMAIIHREVHSLEDLIEIFNNCIWPEEIDEVVNNLTEDEVKIINHYLDNRVNDYDSDTAWEKGFREVK